jgi:hypothetical protein
MLCMTHYIFSQWRNVSRGFVVIVLSFLACMVNSALYFYCVLVYYTCACTSCNNMRNILCTLYNCKTSSRLIFDSDLCTHTQYHLVHLFLLNTLMIVRIKYIVFRSVSLFYQGFPRYFRNRFTQGLDFE